MFWRRASERSAWSLMRSWVSGSRRRKPRRREKLPTLEHLEPRHLLTCGGSVSIAATLTASESTSALAISVTLAGSSCTGGDTATVKWTITSGSAEVGDGSNSDISVPGGGTTGTLTFTSSSTAQTINLTIQTDTADELDERFVITLSDPVNTSLTSSSSSTTVTLTDNDGVNLTIPTCRTLIADSSLDKCEVCTLGEVYYGYADAYTGSYELETSYLFSTGYSASSDYGSESGAADQAYGSTGLSSFVLPVYQSNTMGLTTFDTILTLPSGAGVPDKYSMAVTLKDSSGSTVSTTTSYFSSSGASPSHTAGDQVVFSVQLDPSSAPATGYYTYDSQLTAHYTSSGATATDSATGGAVVVVNRRGSEFGAGWWLDGYDRLYPAGTTGAALVRSDGSTAWFKKTGSSPDVWTNTSHGSFTTLTKDGSNNYVVTTKFNERAVFDSSTGKQLYRYDPAGNAWTYYYNGSGLLDHITDPFGRTVTIGYDGSNKLSTITDYAGRVINATTVTDNGITRLTEIRLPDQDLSSSFEDRPEYEFGYNGSDQNRSDWLLNSITTRAKNNSDAGSATDRTATLLYHDGTGLFQEFRNVDYGTDPTSKWTVEPALQAALDYVEDGTGTSINDTAPIVRTTDLEGGYVDESGTVTTYVYDECGDVDIIKESFGGSTPGTTFDRYASGLISDMWGPDPDGDGPLLSPHTSYVYESTRGNLTSQTNPDGTTVYFTYDTGTAAKFSIPTTYTDETGRITKYEIDPDYGTVNSITHVVGQDDSIDNSEPDLVTARITYSDDGSFPYSSLPDGLVWRIEELLDTAPSPDAYVRTEFDYYDTSGTLSQHGRVKSIIYDSTAAAADQIKESFAYDSNGYLTSYTDGEQRRTNYTRDRLGEITTITQPYPYVELDNGASFHFATTGDWSTISGSGHRGSYIKHTNSDTATAVWTYTGLIPGTSYEVFTTWVENGQNSTSAPYVINYGGAQNTTVNANQQNAISNSDNFGDDTGWYSLGTFTVVADSLIVTLNQAGSGTVVADAVRVTQARPVTSLQYNAVGDVLSITDPLANVTKYTYDLRSRPTVIQQPDPDGSSPYSYPTTFFTYDAASNLKSVVDPLGRRTEYQYDAWQRLSKVLSPFTASAGEIKIDDGGSGYSTTAGSWTTQGSGSGGGSRYAVGGGDTDAAEWSFTGLEAGKEYELVVTWPADASNGATNVPFQVYDGTSGSGTLKATVPVDQHSEPPDDLPVLGGKWRSLGTFTPTGGQPQLTVRLSDSGVASGKRVVADEVRLEPRPVTALTYDFSNNLDTVTDPLGNITDYDYDIRDRLISVTEPAPAGGQAQPVTRYGYFDDSQLRYVADPLNRTTRYEYDKVFGRATKAILPHPDISSPTLKEVDDVNPPSGDYSRATSGGAAWSNVTGAGNGDDYQHITLTGGQTASATWTFPNLTATESYEVFATWHVDVLNNSTAAPYTVAYTGSSTAVNANQRREPQDGKLFNDARSWESLGVFTLPGGVTQLTVTLSGVVGAKVVADGIRVIKKAPTYSYTYDDAQNLKQSTDPLGNVTAFAYDHFHRLTSRTDPDPDSPGSGVNSPVTTYGYDKAHNLVSLSDPECNTTYFAYDGLDQLAEERVSLSGSAKTRRYAYDLAGNLLRRTDRNGRPTRYVYDDLHRLTAEEWLDDEDDVIQTLAYGYDAAGQLVSGDDDTVDSHYDFLYNGLGQIKQENVDNFNHTYEFASLFDRNGRRTSLTAKIGSTKDFQNSYLYDNLNRLKRLDQTSQASGNTVAEKRVDFTYTLASQFETITRYKNTDGGTSHDVAQSTYTYDRMGRLTNLLHEELNGSASTLASYAWTFDAGSRITGLTHGYLNSSQQSVTDTFVYTQDNTDQLKTVTKNSTGTESYSYDENGNRTMSGYSTGEFNRLLASPTHAFTYDAEGNQTTRTNLDTGVRETMDWDHRNRLTSIATDTPREVAHWTFDETSGSTAHNSAGTTLDGTLQADATFSANGAPVTGGGGSLSLDGSNAYVSMGNQDDLKLRTHNLSFALWFKPDVNSTMQLMGQGNVWASGGSGYDLSYHGGDSPKTVEFRINDGSGSYQAVTETLSSGLSGAWHHAAVTVDRSGYIKLYLDGDMVESAGFNQTVNSDIQGTTAFVGGGHDGGTWTFDGLIDEMRVWHEVLDEDDVESIYASAAPLYDATKGVTYDYDPFDRRIRKRIDSDGDSDIDETHEYVYHGQDIVLAVDGGGSLTNRYLHGPAVDQVLADEQYGADSSHNEPASETGIVYWTLGDNLGSVRDLADNDGAVVNHITFDGFGQVTAEWSSAPTTIYGFTGRETDAESHLQYNRARYYDAAIGRWTSEDPLSFAAGDENLYRYVGNQPTKYGDPSGKIFPLVAGAVIIVYSFWPDTANAPAPGDKTYPSQKDAGIPAAAAAGVTVGIVQGAIGGVFAGPINAVKEAALLTPRGAAAAFRWGVGAADAAQRAATITLAEIQAAGITLAVAQQWLVFYQNAVACGRGGETAVERVKLMQRIIVLLGGK